MTTRFSFIPVVAMMAIGGVAAQNPPRVLVANQAPAKLQPFDYGDVTLLNGPLKDASENNRRYLRSLSPDRFLWIFRQNAGIPVPDEPYGGWENPKVELRGHSIGHYLSACARTFAVSKDGLLKKNADYTVAELARCQARLGDGYLSAFPATFFDRLESYKPVWAPYYTIHKIMVGLWEMYRYTANQQALDVLRSMAGYFKARCDKIGDSEFQRILENEYGGMQEVLLNLYSVTGERAHLELAQRFEKNSFIPPLRNGVDVLPGRHANTHIPQIAGAARRFELTGDENYRKPVEFFWRAVSETQNYATGGSNNNEHWMKPGELPTSLSERNQEFCTSYNWLKINRYLLSWTGDTKYGDMYERNFYNGILVSQDPRTGMLTYWLPMRTASRKRFGTPFDTFTCCYGTGIQAYAGLTEGIYFKSDDSIYVNLYTGSAVNWKTSERMVRLVQRTEYPAQPSTRLLVETREPATFSLMLRIPWWATKGASVRVNGEPFTAAAAQKPGTWLKISRTWRANDQVELTIPMSLYAEPIKSDPTLAAVMYGPLVLAGIIDNSQRQANYPTPVFTGDPQDFARWIEQVAGDALRFRTVGQLLNLTFMPLHQVVDEDYGVYWRFARPGSPACGEFQAALKKLLRRKRATVESVTAAEIRSERAHDFRGEQTRTPDQVWGRSVAPGGFISYRLEVHPQRENILVVGYDRSPSRETGYRISVDGTVVAALRVEASDLPTDVEYSLPRSLTQGKTKVTVRIDKIAAQGRDATAVLGLSVLRR